MIRLNNAAQRRAAKEKYYGKQKEMTAGEAATSAVGIIIMLIGFSWAGMGVMTLWEVLSADPSTRVTDADAGVFFLTMIFFILPGLLVGAAGMRK